jgi:hypothetical protein
MALTIIAGEPIETNRDDGRLWFAQNGAKRTRLTLYAAGVHIERVDTEVYVARNAVPVWTRESWTAKRPSICILRRRTSCMRCG